MVIDVPGGVILVGARGNHRLAFVPRMDGHSASFGVQTRLNQAAVLGSGDAMLFDKLRRLAEDECLAVQWPPSPRSLTRAIANGLASGTLVAVSLVRVTPERPDSGDKADASHLPPGTVDRLQKLLMAACDTLREAL